MRAKKEICFERVGLKGMGIGKLHFCVMSLYGDHTTVLFYFFNPIFEAPKCGCTNCTIKPHMFLF